jgi:hypothetical protein
LIGRSTGWKRSSGRQNLSASANEAFDNGFADAPRPTCNQNPFVVEIGCFLCLWLILHDVL